MIDLCVQLIVLAGAVGAAIFLGAVVWVCCAALTRGVWELARRGWPWR